MSGVYTSSVPIETTPHSTSDLLSGKDRITATDIHTAIAAGPAARVTELSFKGASLDAAALIALAEELPKLTNLTALELSGCLQPNTSSEGLKAVVSACCASTSLQRLVLANCGLQPTDVSFLASDVAPWSDTIVDWDISGNPLVGAGAVLELIAGLGGRPCLRLNVSNTGVNDSRSAAAVLSEVSGIGGLVMLGVDGNDGMTTQAVGAALQSIDALLLSNAEVSGAKGPHVSLFATLQNEEVQKREAAKQFEQQSAATAASSSTSPNSPTSVAPTAEVRAPKAAKAKSTVKRGESPVKKRGESPVSKQQPIPTTTTSSVRRGTAAGSPARRPATANTQPPVTSKGATPTRRQGSPAPTPNASVARSSRGVTPNKRGASESRQGSPARDGDYMQGYQEWIENKAKYNDYIHSGRKKKPSEDNQQPKFYTYKYAFGSSVDKVRDSGARVAQSITVVRNPTPQEVRELAPWFTDAHYKTCPGKTTLVDDPKHPGGKIKFVDGGDLRSSLNDPRDIGFIGRKRAAGELPQTRTGGFASSTTRDGIRFGADTCSQAVWAAQAPGPGYYTVKSEFEVSAEKAKVNAANRAPFGSKSERIVFNKTKVDPNEGDKPVYIYEIP